MRKYLLLLAFLASCGSPINYDVFTEYTPVNSDKIGQRVFNDNGLDYALYTITFYYGGHEAMDANCAEGVGVPIGCDYPEYGEILILDDLKHECHIIAHELIHQALFYTTGSPDAEHKNPQFKNAQNTCIEAVGIEAS